MSSTITVGSIADLNAAITSVDTGTSSGTVTIDITSDIVVSSNMLAFNLASGVAVDIMGNGHTLDGVGYERGLFVYAGTVNIQDLTLADMYAQGGSGGAGSAGGGGGGAGVGGGMVVLSAANTYTGGTALDAGTLDLTNARPPAAAPSLSPERACSASARSSPPAASPTRSTISAVPPRSRCRV